jgi:hypothetical protein
MRFLVRFTLAIAVLAGIYFAFIRFVDPYGEYGAGKFPLLVLDSRRAKLQLFHRFAEQTAVDGLILGSSRSLLMRPAALDADHNARIFNFAVDNAHAEDFLAIYHYVLTQKANPKFLVIGLDVPSLHSDDVPDHMFDRSELKDFLELGNTSSSWNSLQWLADAHSTYTKDYLKDAFKAIQMKIEGQTPKTKFSPDGYEMQYSGAELPPGEVGPGHDFSDATKTYMQRLSGMRDLSPKRLGYLTQLFAEARQHHTTVVVWLTPIHPRLYELINASTSYRALIDKVNTEAQNWTSTYGVRYKDYSDLTTFGGVDVDWNDATHMNGHNMDRVARALVREVRYGL